MDPAGQALAFEPVGEPILACSNPDYSSGKVAFKGLGYEAGGTAFLFTCGAKPGRLDLRTRRLEQLPANSIIAKRPDGSLLLIGATALGEEAQRYSSEAFFTADGQKLLIVGTQFLEVRSATGAVLSDSNFSEGMAEDEADGFMVPMAMAMAPDGLSILVGFPRGWRSCGE